MRSRGAAHGLGGGEIQCHSINTQTTCLNKYSLAMDALLHSEQKQKLTSQPAILLFICSALVIIIGLCVTMILRRRRKQAVDNKKNNHETNSLTQTKWAEPSCDWATLKRMLQDSARWSGANRWGERERPPKSPLLGHGLVALEGWHSHNSTSPVWQRPILMGEKCQYPMFSGLILYDQTGRLLHQSSQGNNHQEKPETVVPKTTLRELLL